MNILEELDCPIIIPLALIACYMLVALVILENDNVPYDMAIWWGLFPIIYPIRWIKEYRKEKIRNNIRRY